MPYPVRLTEAQQFVAPAKFIVTEVRESVGGEGTVVVRVA
jgi:hypothetical protein